jgi:hypothetical protein
MAEDNGNLEKRIYLRPKFLKSKPLVFIFCLFCSGLSFGQWNMQAGYDFGTFRIPQTGQKGFNFVHRSNISGEYIFPSNIMLSLNFGYDMHKIDYFFSYETNHPTYIGSFEYIYRYDMKVKSFKTGLSLGYNLELGEASNVQFRASFDGFIVSNVSVNMLNSQKWAYDVYTEQIDDNQPVSTKVEHDPNQIDMEKIRTANRYFIFSLHYKYEYKNYFISPHVGFSPLNRGFILSEGQNLYLAGLRLGYTFSKKDKQNEK